MAEREYRQASGRFESHPSYFSMEEFADGWVSREDAKKLLKEYGMRRYFECNSPLFINEIIEFGYDLSPWICLVRRTDMRFLVGSSCDDDLHVMMRFCV